MTDKENPPKDYGSYLERLWNDRVNLPAQLSASTNFGAKVEILRYALAEGESEQARRLALLAESQSEQEKLRALLMENESQQENLRALLIESKSGQGRLRELLGESETERLRLNAAAAQERIICQVAQTHAICLEDTLTRNLRKPWLPLKDALNRRLSCVAERLVRPFSEYRAMRFRHSAKKRDPRRFMSLDRSTQIVPVACATNEFSGYAVQTQTILKRYFPSDWRNPPAPLHMQLGSAALVRNRLRAAPKSASLPLDSPPAFSIVTPFYSHLAFFSDCAKSIAAVARQTEQPFEWVVFNDDPSVADDKLQHCIPETVRGRTRVLSDGQNHGISRALHFGISATVNSWVVLLDCDDMLEPNALDALAAAINTAPKCRYFSSLMIDIDDAGQELRRRREDHQFTDLFEAGMVAGHMIAFRRDLYMELGGFDPRFSGVQDYDFVLRAAAREQIQRIAMHLYRYRWHSNTQSVSRLDRQAHLTNAVRAAFLSETMGLRPVRTARPPLPEHPEIFCIMRTQGSRMELLAAAVESVRAQPFPTTPCIVVHGDRETVDFVRRHLPTEFGARNYARPAILLQAGEINRRRGYPCNVALEYLRAHASSYDLLCFLDDDDHLLPCFAERLTRLIRLTGADMAYGMANALPKNSEPYLQHKLRPTLSLLLSNFIPFNSFLVRVDAVLETNAAFAEDMHYLEDQDFLVQLFGSGMQTALLTEVISEYRLLGDGNADFKQDPDHFRNCQRKVQQRAKVAAGRLSESAFWIDVLAFPTQDRSAFDEVDLDLLHKTRDLLTGLGGRVE